MLLIALSFYISAVSVVKTCTIENWIEIFCKTTTIFFPIYFLIPQQNCKQTIVNDDDDYKNGELQQQQQSTDYRQTFREK